MKKLTLLTMLVVFGVTASPAFGQATRTWVSGVGNDADPCSREAPCRTWFGALTKTVTGGEIDALDPGGFGSVTINKSITIDGGGSTAGTLASGVTGFTIDIPENVNDPNRRVVLRNLAVNGSGAVGNLGTSTGINGINITDNGAATVELKNLDIFNFRNYGIRVAPTAPPDGPLNLTLDNVFISEIGRGSPEGSPGNALHIAPGTGHTVNALVRNSELKGSHGPAGAPAGTAGVGLLADSGAHVWLTGTAVFNNDLGLQTLSTLGAPGVIDSYCDNQLNGNANNGVKPNELCPQPVTPAPQIITQTVPGPVQCVVPSLKGLPTPFAKKLLKAANCALGKVTRKATSKRRQVGKVMSQKTRAGTKLAEGSKVAVTVGKRKAARG